MSKFCLTEALKSACKCVPIDPDWPIQDPVHAMELVDEFEQKEYGIVRSQAELEYRITHSHACEGEDLAKYGYDLLYEKSLATKMVSIAWHLAGRYEYDNELIQLVEQTKGVKLQTLFDFGAAPWIQAILYTKKGLNVSISNKNKDSDVNRFGRFLAKKSGLADGAITEYDANDTSWKDKKFDIVYTIDVLEHIPPHADGSPAWVDLANALYDCTKHYMFTNAPIDYDTTCHPVESHPVHFTSPYTFSDFERDKKLKKMGYFLRKK